MVVNRFFSAVVRIQADRGHTVVDAGRYQWTRHPAYAGGAIANLAVPLMLGWACRLIPGALTARCSLSCPLTPGMPGGRAGGYCRGYGDG